MEDINSIVPINYEPSTSVLGDGPVNYAPSTSILGQKPAYSKAMVNQIQEVYGHADSSMVNHYGPKLETEQLDEQLDLSNNMETSTKWLAGLATLVLTITIISVAALMGFDILGWLGGVLDGILDLVGLDPPF